jgi:hypothetical protein
MHAVDQMCLARIDVSNLFKTLEYGERRQLRGKRAVEGFCTTSESNWSLTTVSEMEKVTAAASTFRVELTYLFQ